MGEQWETVKKRRYNQLETELRNTGKPVTGNKADLVRRVGLLRGLSGVGA